MDSGTGSKAKGPDADVGDADVGFEEVEHTADWALRIQGRNWPALLANAARGVSSLLVGDLTAIPDEIEKQFEFESVDAESLLVDWLSELAYWAEMERVVFRQFDLSHVTTTALKAVARGGRVSDLQKHIKAVTYHNLEIIETKEGLEATVVFDV